MAHDPPLYPPPPARVPSNLTRPRRRGSSRLRRSTRLIDREQRNTRLVRWGQAMDTGDQATDISQ